MLSVPVLPKLVKLSTSLLTSISDKEFPTTFPEGSETLDRLCSTLSGSGEVARSGVLYVLASISNKLGLGDFCSRLTLSDFELFFRLSTIELQHLLMTQEGAEESGELFQYFSLLDAYMAIFTDENSSQILLDKLTAETLERYD